MLKNISQIHYSLYTPEEMENLKEVVVIVIPTPVCSIDILLNEAKKINPTTIIVKNSSTLESDENIILVSSTDLDKMAADLVKKSKAREAAALKFEAISWEIQNQLHKLNIL